MYDKDLSASRAEVFGGLFFLAQHVAREVDIALEPLGLTTKQWLLLALLSKKLAGETPTLSEAARWHGSSRQNVKKIAEQLKRRGYIKLEPDPTDARAIRLRLTTKIRAFETRPELARQAALMDSVFAWAEAEEIEALRGLLRRWASLYTPKE